MQTKNLEDYKDFTESSCLMNIKSLYVAVDSGVLGYVLLGICKLWCDHGGH